MPALDVSHLVKKYRSHDAVRDISFAVEAGEIVGLLGPNGAGKSTTMRVCAQVLTATSGTISIAGALVAEDPMGAKRRTGFVPDVGGLFPRLTGWEHLELAARLWDLGPLWVERARNLVGDLGLSDAAGRRAGTYSHGMSRRLAIAIAMLSEPQLLLLDEPFDGVDPAGVVAVRDLTQAAAAAGAGVLVSTHLLDAAAKLCDRIVVVVAGTVAAVGTPASLADDFGGGDLEAAYLELVT